MRSRRTLHFQRSENRVTDEKRAPSKFYPDRPRHAISFLPDEKGHLQASGGWELMKLVT